MKAGFCGVTKDNTFSKLETNIVRYQEPIHQLQLMNKRITTPRCTEKKPRATLLKMCKREMQGWIFESDEQKVTWRKNKNKK